jgi:hypothetical protein
VPERPATPPPTLGSRTRRAVAALLAAGSLAALAACGGSQSSTDAELQARRTDLAAVAHALSEARKPVSREVAAARVAWPLMDRGIPHAQPTQAPEAPRHALDPAAKRKRAALLEQRSDTLKRHLAALKRAALAAAAASQRLSVPLLAHSEELTGAGSGITSVYELGTGLVNHGWNQVAATLAVGKNDSPAARAFLRANVTTYIISVYDGNFDLSLLGKLLEQAYRRLGGAKVFGHTLTPSQVVLLARAYSPGADRLTPHPWQGLVSE